jgi:hypothetical protein
MENVEPDLFEWAEDICEICGAHVGYGVRLFHLSRCDEHSGEEEEEEDAEMTALSHQV